MADILARNPKLDDIIRKAANRLGENHGLATDNHGMVIDNEGNSTRYVGSNGRHPSRTNTPNITSGWHRILNEKAGNPCGEDYECGGACTDDDSSGCPFWCGCKCVFDSEGRGTCQTDSGEKTVDTGGGRSGYQAKKEPTKTISRPEDVPMRGMEEDCGELGEDCGRRHEEEMEEAMGASSAGGYVGPLSFETSKENVKETKNILKSIVKEEIYKKLNEHKRLNEDKVCRCMGQTWYGHDGPIMCNTESSGVQAWYASDCCNSTMETPEGCWVSSRIGKHAGVKGGGKDVVRGTRRISETKALKHRLTRKILNEKDYFSGKYKYEKVTKLPGEIKNTPGMKKTTSVLKKSGKENSSHLKQVDKKIKDYLNFKDNSHPEFPHQNNSKTDYKSPMYRNNKEDEDFIDDFRGMGLQDANGVETLDRIDDYLKGSSKTGNSQEYANAIPDKTGDKMLKTMKRKKKKIAKRKSKMTNLRGYTPDVQTIAKESTEPNVYIVEEKKEIDKIKHLFNYRDTTQ